MNSIDFNVSENEFKIPYQIFSEQEFLNLLNKTQSL